MAVMAATKQPDGQIFAFAVGQITFKTPGILSPGKGRWPSSRTLGWDAVDAAASGVRGDGRAGLAREPSPSRRRPAIAAYGKTVWSWHPLLVSSRRRCCEPDRVCKTVNSLMTVTRRIRRRGERGISRQAIAQGRSDAPAATCMLVCAFLAHIAHETAGASQHPAFPAPSDFQGRRFHQRPGRLASRARERASETLYGPLFA